LIEFTSTVEQYIDQMDVEFTEIKEETSAMKVDIQRLNEQMDCCKLLFKYIMGQVRDYQTSHIQETTEGKLSAEGLAMYEECLESIRESVPDFSFNRYNLLF
jgi:hypothetical protein